MTAPAPIAWWWIVVSLAAGAVVGVSLSARPSAPPPSARLAKTDGAICLANPDGSGPHWLVRSDGFCYAEDNPVLRVDQKALDRALETGQR